MLAHLLAQARVEGAVPVLGVAFAPQGGGEGHGRGAAALLRGLGGREGPARTRGEELRPTGPGGGAHLAHLQPALLQHVALRLAEAERHVQEEAAVLPVAHEDADVGHQVVQPRVEHHAGGVLSRQALQVLKEKRHVRVRTAPRLQFFLHGRFGDSSRTQP